jgi:hypothetical protein
VTYTYNNLQRVTAVSTGATFTYDTATNGLGRVATITYPRGNDSFTESYSYTAGGRVTSKTLQITRNGATGSLAFGFTYDNEGRLTSADPARRSPQVPAISAKNSFLGPTSWSVCVGLTL